MPKYYEKALVKRIRELETRLEQTQKDQDEFESYIREKYPDYHALKYPEPVSLEDLQERMIEENETLMAYNAMDQKTCLWVIGETHVTFHIIDRGARTLGKAIEAYRNGTVGVHDKGLRGTVVYTDSARLAGFVDHLDRLFEDLSSVGLAARLLKPQGWQFFRSKKQF